MPSSETITALQSEIMSAAPVSGCVVTGSVVAGREVLIAHISTEPAAPVPVLKALLPGEREPAHVACWEAIPVSAAGQPDRDELGAQLVGGSCPGYGLDTVEKRVVAGIWADILRPPALGSGDSFLELGGHSILAIRMLTRVKDALGVRIPIYEFLDDPTITGVARQVARKSAQHDDGQVPEDARG
jgi:hypothetical protein